MLKYYTRISDEDYESEGTKPTIGVEFGTKVITLPDGKQITAQIWDTAGQERYRAITRAHYKRANAALIVYDVTSERSFDDAKSIWMSELRQFAGDAIEGCIGFACNKIDLELSATGGKGKFVSKEDHEAFSSKNNLFPVRTSALTGENVDKCFDELIIRTSMRDRHPSPTTNSRLIFCLLSSSVRCSRGVQRQKETRRSSRSVFRGRCQYSRIVLVVLVRWLRLLKSQTHGILPVNNIK